MKQAKLVFYPSKKYIYIYYTKNGKTLKISTEIKISSENEFDEKKQQLTNKYKNHKNDNIILNAKLQRINQLINDAIYNNIYDVINHIKQNINKPTTTTTTHSFDSLFELYLNNIEATNTTKLNRAKSIYRASKAIKINNISDISNTYLKDVVKQLKLTNKDVTILKKLHIAKDFLKSIKHLLNTDVLEHNLEFKHSNKNKAANIAFTLDELIAIKDYQTTNENETIIKDFILLSAQLGCHIKDLFCLNKSKINTNDNTLIYFRQKTKVRCIVPITSEAKALMEKYDYQFNRMTYQMFRLGFKSLLNKIDIFNNDFNIMTIEGEKTVKRKDILTVKATRKYFISNMLQKNVSLLSLMQMIGHSNITELNSYIASELNVNEIDSIRENMEIITPVNKGLNNLKQMAMVSNNLSEIENNLHKNNFEFENKR